MTYRASRTKFNECEFRKIEDADFAHGVAIRVAEDYDQAIEMGADGYPELKAFLGAVAFRKSLAWELALMPASIDDPSGYADHIDSDEVRLVQKMRSEARAFAARELSSRPNDEAQELFDNATLKNNRDIREAKMFREYIDIHSQCRKNKEIRERQVLSNYSVRGREAYERISTKWTNQREAVKFALQDTAEDLIAERDDNESYGRNPFSESGLSSIAKKTYEELISGVKKDAQSTLEVMRLPVDEKWKEVYFRGMKADQLIEDSVTRVRFMLSSRRDVRVVDATILLEKTDGYFPNVKVLQKQSDFSNTGSEKMLSANKAHILIAANAARPTSAGLPTLGRKK